MTDPSESAQAVLSPEGEQRHIPVSEGSNGREAPSQRPLPVDSLKDAAPFLRRPFDLYAVQFRALEGAKGERLNCAAYITARTAVDRLNLVCPGLWSDHYEPVTGGLRCDLTIDGMTRSDVGWSAPASQATAMGLKALYSDAFKRAAVKFGVGVSLYALPRLVLLVREKHATAVAIRDKQDKYGNQLYRYGITASGMSELRARYERWLVVQTSFGDALPHGHIEGSADPEDETQVEQDSAETTAVATEGDKKMLKEAVKGLLFQQVKVCFSAAGLSAPTKREGCWEGIPRDKIAPLVKELQGARRLPRKDAGS